MGDLAFLMREPCPSNKGLLIVAVVMDIESGQRHSSFSEGVKIKVAENTL